MLTTTGYGTPNTTTPLAPFTFQRREVGPDDVLIKILYCGVCHSDIHQSRDEWGIAMFPMVPGHEIVGKVTQIGSSVKHFKVGDTVGVGCMVDSCRTCTDCQANQEQFCNDVVFTYSSPEKGLETPTFGGYSSQIVVDEKYVLHMPENLALDRAAPLLCAGITTYSPLKYCNVRKGQRVAIAGLGGLGHMAVKFAVAMGADVTVLSSSPNKEADAKKLGAHHFALTSDKNRFTQLAEHFDLILDTVSAPHDLDAYLGLLKRDGVMVLVGVSPDPLSVNAFSIIWKRKKLMGSLIGGIAETQEMLDFCGKHNILPEVEMIPIQQINAAYERMIKGDVHYRFVIDMKSLE